MKKAGFRHVKTYALARELGIDRLYAVGVLSEFWRWVAEVAPDGALGKAFAFAAADAIGWKGDASLVDALHASGWIAPHPRHAFVVVGWSEHCEDAVHTALARAPRLFWDGSVPKTTRLAGPERPKAEERLARLHAEFVGAVAAAPENTGVAAPARPEAAASMETPWKLHGEKRPALALALAVASAVAESTEATTTAPPTPRQKSLTLGPVAVPPKRLAAEEEQLALLQAIYLLCEITGNDFTDVALWVTSFKNGKGRRVGTVRISDMTPEYITRSIRDAREIIGKEIRDRGLSQDLVDGASRHAGAYAESHLRRGATA